MADIDTRLPKRVRMSPEADARQFDSNADFISLEHTDTKQTSDLPHQRHAPRRADPRERHDRPKSKHALPGHEPWILVKTKLGRRFVHNADTKESYWRIPGDVQAAVDEFDQSIEKRSNAEWAEQQLIKMRAEQAAKARARQSNGDGDQRQRRRSESLQREDEEAMLAELAAEDGDIADAGTIPKEAPEARGYLGAASDSEYEYYEVTDTEGEDGQSDAGEDPSVNGEHDGHAVEDAGQDDADPGPVEFGEDDIAYQLAMMGESYGLEPEEYGGDVEDQASDEEQAMELSNEEATALFNEMLDEHGVSPFTPWDKLIADNDSTSVVFDARFTLLPSAKARKEAWQLWSRDKAAQVKAERAQQDKQDPRVSFLAFLSQHASIKLYWPEFKRKFKRESELNSRALQEKDREKLYRELVAKLKLPESKRKEELHGLLEGLPNRDGSGQDGLPDKVLTSVVLYSLPSGAREQVLQTYGYQNSLAI